MLINPDDTLERQNEKLKAIASSLMRRVEQQTDQSGIAYAQFERAALLEDQVRTRTRDLEQALKLLHESNVSLERANADVEAAQSNLTDAIETITEGFALFDNSDTLVLSNSHFCELFEDISGKLIPGMHFDGYVDLISRSDFLQLPPGETPEGWAAMRKSRHARRNALFNTQLKGDRWLQVSERRTPNNGTVVLQTDVTDIIRLEREERARLKDQQSRLIAATLDHLAQGVCIFDDQQRLVGWNTRAAELLKVPVTRIALGARFAALIDHMPRDFILSDKITRRGLLEWAARPSERRAIRFELTQPNTLVLDAFAQALPDGGFVISFTDVTEERAVAARLRALNEELEARVAERTTELEAAVASAERANASKSRFVAAASHDLLQPLSAAKLFVGALQGGQKSGLEEDTLSKALSALGAVEGIIDALLDISRLESGRAVFDKRAFPLSQIFRALNDELSPLAQQKGLQFRMVDSSLMVQSDPSYLRRIIQNLATNAVRYTRRGRVVLGARRVGRDARIEVWDTGPGIAPEHQAEIFQEFRRLDAPASASEGLGLGLAIVERACAGLGHSINLRSTPGHGTTFSVTVPTARAQDSGTAEEVAPIMGRPGTDRLIFVVENDNELRRAMAMTLEGFGADVIDVPNAEAGLELLAELGLKPDAFLIDQQLGPGRSGTEFYDLVKKLYGPIPARIVSALRDPAFEAECAKVGAPLFPKPLAPADLAAFLHGLTQDERSETNV
ncbi:PAS-domain containing protein [Primorskyibacter sp. S187A]|uniref:sensor histidine kinase n=1 Tax=Primorskyibacter sp. S187A TaxID=3415130 RepID=UPI003C7C5DE7